MAHEEDAHREREQKAWRVQETAKAYADLKQRLPLLEQGEDGKLLLCGRVWAYRPTGVNTADGSTRYSLEGSDGYGDWVYDMASLGRWLIAKAAPKPVARQRGWFERTFGL